MIMFKTRMSWFVMILQENYLRKSENSKKKMAPKEGFSALPMSMK